MGLSLLTQNDGSYLQARMLSFFKRLHKYHLVDVFYLVHVLHVIRVLRVLHVLFVLPTYSMFSHTGWQDGTIFRALWSDLIFVTNVTNDKYEV